MARHASTRRRRRGLIAVLAVLAVLLGGAGVAGALAYVKLNGNIRGEQVEDRLGDSRPPPAAPVAGVPNKPLNILLIGSDTRAGDNDKYGHVTGARGDVTILLHLSADRQRAIGVSIPRDTMVMVPPCVGPDGKTVPGGMDLFNSAFSRGGSACTIRTLESISHLRIDHHVVVDFQGFKSMVDALGKVSVCLPRDVDDKDSGLKLTAGRHEVGGETALAFVRARKFAGSDIDRIERQQKFLSAMIQKATSLGVLANPARLYTFLDAATRSLTTDPALANLNELRKLAQSVQSIGLNQIEFLTVPWEAYPPDPVNRLQLSPQADQVWQSLRTDSPLPGRAQPSPSVSGASSTPAATPLVSVAPSKVSVRVLNGTGRPGVGTQATEELRKLGFSVVSAAPADRVYPTSVVRHDPGYGQSAQTLAAAVPGATLEPTSRLGRTLELVVGADYAGTQPVKVAPAGSKPSPSIKARTADQDVCS